MLLKGFKYLIIIFFRIVLDYLVSVDWRTMGILLSKKSRELLSGVENECIECMKCVQNCVMLTKYVPSPKKMNTEMMNKEIPFSCQLCGHCQSVCPKDIDLKQVFHQCRIDGISQRMINTSTIDWHQRNSFSKLFTTKPMKVKRVFFPGCSLSGSKPNLVKEVYDMIKDDHMDIWLNCCGNPTLTLGKTNVFDKQLIKLDEMINRKEIKEIIVACQNCYKVFSDHLDIKVTSVYELINTLDIEKLPNSTKMALHDPCPTRYEIHIHDAVREIMQKLGIEIEEFEYSREKTKCCGAGAMVKVLNKDVALTQMNRRAEEVTSNSIMTYCQECVDSLSVGGKKTYHLLDVVVHGIREEAAVSTIKHWTNRLILKTKLSS